VLQQTIEDQQENLEKILKECAVVRKPPIPIAEISWTALRNMAGYSIGITIKGKENHRARMVARATQASRRSEQRKASVAGEDCRTDSAGIGGPCRQEAERPFSVQCRTRTKAWRGRGLLRFRSLR